MVLPCGCHHLWQTQTDTLSGIRVVASQALLFCLKVLKNVFQEIKNKIKYDVHFRGWGWCQAALGRPTWIPNLRESCLRLVFYLDSSCRAIGWCKSSGMGGFLVAFAVCCLQPISIQGERVVGLPGMDPIESYTIWPKWQPSCPYREHPKVLFKVITFWLILVKICYALLLAPSLSLLRKW